MVRLRDRVRVDGPRRIREDDRVAVTAGVGTDEPGQLDPEAGFFAGLPAGALVGRLAGLQEAGGQVPPARSRIHGTTEEEELEARSIALALADHRGGGPRVGIPVPPAVRAPKRWFRARLGFAVSAVRAGRHDDLGSPDRAVPGALRHGVIMPHGRVPWTMQGAVGAIEGGYHRAD